MRLLQKRYRRLLYGGFPQLRLALTTVTYTGSRGCVFFSSFSMPGSRAVAMVMLETIRRGADCSRERIRSSRASQADRMGRTSSRRSRPPAVSCTFFERRSKRTVWVYSSSSRMVWETADWVDVKPGSCFCKAAGVGDCFEDRKMAQGKHGKVPFLT